MFAEHRDVRDVLELRADHAAQGELAPLSELSEADNHTRSLLEEQKNRSKMNMQELRVERADRALRELSLQIHSQCMELHQTLPTESPI